MRALRGELLLAAWEQGAREPDQRRVLTLLALALPERGEAALADIPLSEINALLLGLHEVSFGDVLEVFGTCEECGSPFEVSVPVAGLTEEEPPEAGPLVWREHGHEYRLRAATTADLLASLESDHAFDGEERLLSRCLEPVPAGGPLRPSGVIERFERINAGAERTLTITCPACGVLQSLDLDLGRFLWTEVRHQAARLLDDVHALATAYGWSEHEIIEMTGQRRAAYLDLVAA